MTDNLTPAMAAAKVLREVNAQKSRRKVAAAREAAEREREAIRGEQARLRQECLARMAERA